MKLDYTLQTSQERKALVEEILKENPSYPLETLADYLILAMNKEERKQRKILTDNRLFTINKRETSYEGLAASLESGEDGIYNLQNENKNALLQPKVSITQKDLQEIPDLARLRAEIVRLEAKLPTTTGRDLFLLKRTLIELRRDQYVIKNAFRLPVQSAFSFGGKASLHLDGGFYLDANNEVQTWGVSLGNPTIIAEVLNNYSHLKEDGYARFNDDTYYFMEDFDNVSSRALAAEPLLTLLVEMKIDGRQNLDIQKAIEQQFQKSYSTEYLSSLWRKKIPKLIADQAKREWLDWHFLEEACGTYKRCSRCHEIKLAHNIYFSKNKTSKDGFYSICKECRAKKRLDKNN